MSLRGFVPTRTHAARIARKAQEGAREKCPHCQEKLRVSEPGDALEHEADRAANAVMNQAPPTHLAAATGHFQRDPIEDDARRTQAEQPPHTVGASSGKAESAQTPAGKDTLAKASEQAKAAVSTPAGAAAVGVVAGTTVAGLAAANQKLPFQPPAIPLGDSGYKAGLRYEGPIRSPSYAGVTFSGALPGEPKPMQHKEDPSAYRAETARMRAELEQWKPKKPAPAGGTTMPATAPAPAHDAAPPPQPPRKKDGAPPVQRKARGAGAEPVFAALNESGDALDTNTRQFMERRFHRDFSAVRIHSGPRGANAADALNAHAFTYGEHIGFANGEYRPGTESGRHLLAHELAHVAQQGAAPLHAHAATPIARRAETGPAIPPISSAATPTVARAPKPPKGAATVKLGSANELNNLAFEVWPEESEEAEVKGVKRFNVDALVLPPTKGPNALAAYQRYAAGGALSSTVRVGGKDPQASLWQTRAGTEQLKKRWLDKRGWPSGKAADKYWEKAGGDAEFPRVKKAACQMDHVVELQLTGNNTNENIQTLDAAENGASGRTLWAEMSGLARGIEAHADLDTAGAQQIRMRFTRVVMQGAPETLLDTCKGAQGSCLAVENCASKIKVDKSDVREDGTEPYELNTKGGHRTLLNVPVGFAKDAGGTVSFDADNNKAAATLLPGFLLKTLSHGKRNSVKGKGKSPDRVDATIDTEGKTRLPLVFGTDKAPTGNAGKKATAEKKNPAPGKTDAAPIHLDVLPPDNTLKFAEGSVRIPFYYPYLSPGVITRLTPTEDGVDFVGSITPSVPFLGELGIAYEKGALSITKGLDPKNIRLPMRGAKVTKAALGMELAPEFAAKGDLGFEYAPSGKKLLDAALSASADADGLKLAGEIHAYLPGVDSTEGHLEYTTTGGWSGGAKATAKDLQKKFKYVTGGEVSIGIKDGKQGNVVVHAAGTVNLDLPHTKGVSATLENRGERWLFRGKGTFEVPRLKPVDIEIEYDGEHLHGEARNIGFQYKGFDASIDVRYRDEKFSGSGKLAFEKGRAKGMLQINLLPSERFTGKGNVTLQIREGLEASAGVELDQDEKLHIAGKLAFTKPIKLFDGFGGDATIFKAGISIPIPGASIGPVGVKARIDGELSAGYHIGPGEIRNASAEAHFDPLSENPNFELEIGGQLWIGASAHITGAVSGSIVLDAVIAEASGGLTISATASLDGEVLSNVKFTYAKDRYALTADFAASLALAIKLALEAFVHAQAGVGPFSVETEKRWTLAAKEFNTGLKLGIAVKKPLSYSSDKGLEVPAASDIEVTKPSLDASRLLKDVFGASDGKERKL